jgi:1-acyl-sn-glycerol-3-phosphate acyltransferase
MQQIIIDKPYRFVPPLMHRWWIKLLLPILPGHLKKNYGVHRIETEHADRIKQSISAGHAVIVTPNHCRDSDPMVLSALLPQVKSPFFIMASWHLFMQGFLQRFLTRCGGAFSIYREGMDRQALAFAGDVLENAVRPLIIFPEGVISLTNDHLNPFMDGVALIARQAAKKRAKMNPPKKVVVHPIAIRYRYIGSDLYGDLKPVLGNIEQRLSWQPQDDLPLKERLIKLGYGLLAAKEVEYFSKPQSGEIADRLASLINRILNPVEDQWVAGRNDGAVIARVKRIRAAILPELLKADLDEKRKNQCWRHLADVYMAQQIAMYQPDYIADNPTPERLLEMANRYEDNLTDTVTPQPLAAKLTVGEALEVTEKADGLMDQIEERIRAMLGI